jgi:hypothetical protein
MGWRWRVEQPGHPDAPFHLRRLDMDGLGLQGRGGFKVRTRVNLALLLGLSVVWWPCALNCPPRFFLQPTPYSWPDINSHFGILDIAGFPKDRYFWYRSWFVQPSEWSQMSRTLRCCRCSMGTFDPLSFHQTHRSSTSSRTGMASERPTSTCGSTQTPTLLSSLSTASAKVWRGREHLASSPSTPNPCRLPFPLPILYAHTAFRPTHPRPQEHAPVLAR